MAFFCCSGIIPSLLSSTLIASKFKDEKNIIIIENALTKLFLTPYKKTSGYEKIIIDLILKSSSWDEVHSISFENTYVSIRRLLPFLPYVPIESFRIIKNKKNIVSTINKIISNTKLKNLVVSDNSILLKYFYKKKFNVSFLEHGAASYRSGFQKRDFRYFLKGIISKFSTLSLNIKVNSIYLSDNCNSYRSQEKVSNNNGVKAISCDLSSDIKKLYYKFILNFKEKFPEAYDELVFIRNKSKHQKMFIYMPTAEMISNKGYYQYLQDQLNQFESDKNSFFLIKPRGDDIYRDYLNYFNLLGLEAVTFKEEVNLCIPVEFLTMFFESSTMVSSYSSSHLYIRWWLGKKTIFTEVKNHPVNKYLVNEYNAVRKDFLKLQSTN